MRRLALVLLAAVLAGVLTAALREAPPAAPPNVLLILTDDQGWGDVRSHGNPLIDTPRLDRLAREGARFERFYVSPVCAPTRASLLTGRYALRTGVHGVTRGFETMRSDEVTLAEVLRDAGYATGLFGKWHNGAHYPHDPTGQGFDTFFGFALGHLNNYFDPLLEHGGTPARTDGFVTDVLTDSALAFIRRHRSRPFFAYVPYNAPHSPFQVPDRYFEKYTARGLSARTAAAYGMVENIDDNVGRLLDALDALGLRENTLVLFLTDNGPNGDRYDGGMRGAKASVHEGGVRVPLFVRWPGVIPAGRTVRALAAHIDLLPTIADLAGVPVPEGLVLDGLSLAPSLRGEEAGVPPRRFFTHWSGPFEVRPYPGAVRTARWRAVHDGTAWALYDLLHDPAERVDVAADEPETARMLAAAYDDWFADVTAEGFSDIPAEIGHAERPEVVLPGHEARLHPAAGEGIGYVERNGWANDWITRWTDPAAYAAWPIDVVRAGRYAVAVRYSARADQVGARLRVEAGAARVEERIEAIHDPPFLPAPDRVPRGEVHEKEWATQALGSITLAPGPETLHLRAVSIPGTAAPDVKAVVLRRLED